MKSRYTTKSPLRVGVIGVGIGRVHLNAYKQLSNVSVEAICDIDEARGSSTAKEFGVKKFYNDATDLFADDKVDAVSVCVPNNVHAELVVQAAKAGKHILCEKPISNTLAGAQKIEEAARKVKANGKVFMLAMNNRYRGDTQVLRRFIDAGELGDIYHAKCGWIRRTGIPGMGGWFTTKAKSGGGPLIDIGVHVLDLTMYLMGNPVPVSAYGTTHAKFGPRGLGSGAWGAPPKEAAAFDVEDFAAGFVKFQNGATLAIEASWASHIKEDSFYSTLLGTEGGADLEPLTIYRTLHGVPVDLKPKFPNIGGHDAEVKHFVECICNSTTPISTAEQGLHVLQILDAIYRSSASGHEVVIEK
ncbi:MAG: Gfo/Idh/MocA family oxidoreductase [Capsulimonadaceae bacterium]|nr:Gfo/Idh/MocA family oxidoreductase [Capsulimonadaceae bacterium]